jgi:hypothetical protein
MRHERLLNQATMHGTDAVLQQLPAEHSPELEKAIRQGVRQAVLYYAHSLDTIDRQLRPLAHPRDLSAVASAKAEGRGRSRA